MRRIPVLIWAMLGLVLGLAAMAAASIAVQRPQRDNPRARLPQSPPHTSHTGMLAGPFATPQDVTRACLKCHPQAAAEVMSTSHWTWESDGAQDPHTGMPIRIGKKNMVNNYCIGVQGNEQRCMSCHAGYGWKDSSFNFNDSSNIDCLVCHDTSGSYRKDPDGAGYPAKDVDLLAVARSVGRPTRRNCGYCHFAGGGGDAVKHGDMDGTMYFPNERIDVHMGRFDMQCLDCHRTSAHQIRGRLLSVSNRAEFDVACTDCHSPQPHRQARLNAHTSAVSCQACHIPAFAVEAATKMYWDWSQAGQPDTVHDPHVYDKKKGRFEYRKDVTPEYYWYNGAVQHVLPGQTIDASQTVQLNQPQGNIREPRAQIWPFKVHRGKQIYDTGYNYFITPTTAGEGGYWTTFDWDSAMSLGSKATGLPYSGKYGFTATEMYWPITHMVAPKDRALQCVDCHGANGRLNWRALGYEGDPLVYGGREREKLVDGAEGRQ